MKAIKGMAVLAAAVTMAGCATCPHPDSSGWEDVFNKVLYGRIKHLPIRYNTFAPFIYLREKAFTEIYGADHIRAARRAPARRCRQASDRTWPQTP